jgi:hypothetical protein
MAVFALDLVLFWLTGVRSHLQRFDGLGPAPAPGPVTLVRVVGITAAVCAVVSAALWWSVRLAIELH